MFRKERKKEKLGRNSWGVGGSWREERGCVHEFFVKLTCGTCGRLKFWNFERKRVAHVKISQRNPLENGDGKAGGEAPRHRHSASVTDAREELPNSR